MHIDENAPGNISQKGVTSGTDNETGHDSTGKPPADSIPEDNNASVDEDMADVEAADSVASEHPAP
ncbi:MAG: hypothetical protein PW845_02880 [Pseudomonas sp.]|nr:hypothetical protein [Pseudomonas sp.]